MRKNPTKICCDCGKPISRNQPPSKRCQRCYFRKRAIPDDIRFWKYVRKTKKCWLWVGAKVKDGYGGFTPLGRKMMRAHRFSWMLDKGFIPKGFWVLHKCDNPPCVKPKHLFIGTPKENVADMIKKGRKPCGEKHHKAKLTEKNVKEIRLLYKSMGAKNLAKTYKVNRLNIYDIVQRKTWKHI